MTHRARPFRATPLLATATGLALTACWQDKVVVVFGPACAEGQACDAGVGAEPEARRLLPASTRVPWDVQAVTPLADGRRALFLADDNDLFLVALDGGPSRRLTAHAGEEAELVGLDAAQDRAVLRLRLAYDPDRPCLIEVVPLDGAPPAILVQGVRTCHQCAVAVDPEADRLLHACDSTPPRIEAVGLDGSGSRAISPAVQAEQSISLIAPLPGGEVLYAVKPGEDGVTEIWHLRAGQDQAQRVAEAHPYLQDSPWLLSPDRQRLVIQDGTVTPTMTVLSAMRVDGSERVDLSAWYGAAMSWGDTNPWAYKIGWLAPAQLIFQEASGTDTHLLLADLDAGTREDLTPGQKLGNAKAVDPERGQVVFEAMAQDVSRTSLVRCDLTAACVTLGSWISGDVERIALSHDGAQVAVHVNSWNGGNPLYTIEAGAADRPGLVEKARWEGAPSGLTQLGFCADSQHLLWIAKQGRNAAHHLYAATVGPGNAQRLSQDLVPFGDVLDFVPAGARVLFRADASANELVSLYAVGLDGAGLTSLHEPSQVAPGEVAAFALVPGQDRAVLMSNHQSHGDDFYPYLVELDGSGARRLLGDLEDGWLTRAWMEMRVDPAGRRLLLQAGLPGPGGLFSVPLDQGPSLRLTQAEIRGLRWTWIALSDDGSRVAWFEISSGNSSRPHVARADGSEHVLLDQGFDPLGAGASSGATDARIAFTPDGQTVVYLAEVAPLRGDELCAVGVDGSGWRRLSPELAEGEELEDDFWIAPDSSRAVFWVRHASHTALHAVGIGTGADTTLASLPPAPWSFGGYPALISPDSQRAAFRERLAEDAAASLVSVRVDGSDRVVLSRLDEAGQSHGTLVALAGTGLMAYPVHARGALLRLEAVPFAGGPATRLDRLAQISDGLRWSWSETEQRLLYLAGDGGGRRALVSVDARGEALLQWSPWVDAGTQVTGWRALPQSARILYQLLDAQGTRLVLRTSSGRERQLASDVETWRFLVSEDERWLVFARRNPDLTMEVASLRLEGLP